MSAASTYLKRETYFKLSYLSDIPERILKKYDTKTTAKEIEKMVLLFFTIQEIKKATAAKVSCSIKGAIEISKKVFVST